MNKKIITTVGTSIFTNYQEDKVKAKLGRDYAPIDTPFRRTHKATDGSEVPASDIYKTEYQPYVKTLKEIITDFWHEYPISGQPNANASAEISSILKITEQENEPCEIHLIATDTLQSVLAAELIVAWFEKYPSPKVSKVLFQRQGTEFKAQKDSEFVVKDLRVESHIAYESGFLHLFELLNDLSKAISKETREVIFNITGGYKALIPVMTLYAQVNRIPLKYLYESNNGKADPIISINSLPFNFDWGLLELLADYIQDKELRAMLSDDSKILDSLRKYKIIKSETRELTTIGNLIEKFIDHRLPEGKTSFGYFAEYKVLEALIEQFKELPKRSVEYWWDKHNQNQYTTMPQYGKDGDKEIRIEIDLVSEKNNKQIWYEVKPYSKTGLNKAYNQAKMKLEFQRLALQAPLEMFRLVLYKFDFETIKNGQQFNNIEREFKNAGVEFEAWYFDVPANLELEKTEIKSFFEQNIELKKLVFQS
jgi:CRISPR/Cas system-associated protein Csm6